jgi:hypothetical protein
MLPPNQVVNTRSFETVAPPGGIEPGTLVSQSCLPVAMSMATISPSAFAKIRAALGRRRIRAGDWHVDHGHIHSAVGDSHVGLHPAKLARVQRVGRLLLELAVERELAIVVMSVMHADRRFPT